MRGIVTKKNTAPLYRTAPSFLISTIKAQIFGNFFMNYSSVDILDRNTQSLLGALFYIVPPPPPLSSSPTSAIIIRRLRKNTDKRGGMGMLPGCCIPLQGREGVTLFAATENKRITGKEDFNKA
jgi:hypothetical protein